MASSKGKNRGSVWRDFATNRRQAARATADTRNQSRRNERGTAETGMKLNLSINLANAKKYSNITRRTRAHHHLRHLERRSILSLSMPKYFHRRKNVHYSAN